MFKNHIPALIERGLAKNRAEIIEQWKKKLTVCESFLLFRATGSIEGMLYGLFYEIQGSAARKGAAMPQLPLDPPPLNAACDEAHILFVGEEVAADVLRKNMKIPLKKWLPVRSELNRIFHRVVRANSSAACDFCKRSFNERITVCRKLTAELRKI